MKFFRIDLLTLLISLFILNSCKNQDTIGLGVDASSQLNGNLIDTSTIVVNTIPEDSVITNRLSRTPLAYFKDPLFGTTEANMAIDLNLPGSGAYEVPPGTITIDSALLVLRYSPLSYSFYGDSIASKYKVNVYQLNERLFAGSTYTNKKLWSYNSGTLLGTKTFISRTHDSLKIINPVAGAVDTIVKVPAQLRIPISTSFINSILFNASTNQLKSNLVFKNAVKGLYITLDKNQAGPGGSFMFALDSAASIQIYYKNLSGSLTDTAIVTLPSSLHAAEIKHTYSTTIQTELANTGSSRNVIYFQGLAGLRSKISFPYLKNIIKTVGSDVLVNRAELVVTASPGSTIPYAPLPKLAIYKFDLAHQRTFLQDAVINDPRAFGPTIFGGFYDPSKRDYHFIITGYIQDLIRGVTKDSGTFIGPTVPNTTSVDIQATPQIDGRTFAVGSDLTSPYRIKLNIIYTKIGK